jgi:hypothetical protein
MNLKNHYLESLAVILAQMQTFAIYNSNKKMAFCHQFNWNNNLKSYLHDHHKHQKMK